MKDQYYFIKRPTKKGDVWYCVFDYLPDKPKSTKIFLANDPDQREAARWAEKHYGSQFEKNITLDEFAKDFFIEDKCSWSRRTLEKGHTYNPVYFKAHRGRLKNHILPEFGGQTVDSITTKQIDTWLLSLIRDKKLSTAAIEKIITALDKIFKEAIYQGIITYNPTKAIETFKDTSPERETFTTEEIQKLFPHDEKELFYIWQSRMWATYFMALAFCGLRPGEAKAISPSVWYRDTGVVVIKRSVENLTRKVQDSIKTSKRGVKKKIAVLPNRLTEQLLMLELVEGLSGDELFFTLNGRPIGTETALKHFKLSARRAGVDLRGRTPYCLRHTFNTFLYELVTLEELQKSMGHVSQAMTNLYLHPTDELLARKSRREPMTVHEAVNLLYN